MTDPAPLTPERVTTSLGGAPSGWTEPRIERLRELWESGLPTRKIGLEMGISKNSVIAKARRLGLSSRAQPLSTKRPAILSRQRSERKRIIARTVREVRRPRRNRNRKRIASSRPAEFRYVNSGNKLDRMLITFGRRLELPICHSDHALPFIARERNQCAYPLWTDTTLPAERMVCGAPTLSFGDDYSCSWCSHHFAIVTEPRRAEA